MQVVNTGNNLSFQSQLNISKITSDKRDWRRLAERFSDHDYKDVFDLASMKNGGVKGQYRSNIFENTVDFIITPKGVCDLLDKSENRGAIFFKVFELDILKANGRLSSRKNILKIIDDCKKLIHHLTDDNIEKCNFAIASNNKFFEGFNKAYKDVGISLDYPPLNYVRKPITNPNERNTRINTVNKRIHETNTEINALEKDIQELSSKSLITRLYNKLTGKEDIKKTIKNKTDQKEYLELTLQVLNDELKYLTSL